MSVVSASYFSLIRTRKSLQLAFKHENWDEVRACDRLLGESLNAAFEDDNRDTSALIEELERVLNLYATIVASLPEQAENLSLGKGCTVLPASE